MIPVSAYAAQSADAPLGPFAIQRRQPGPTDVHIEILFCGVCHSDLHTARSEWPGFTVYPVVPGHEIVGRVVSVGSGVKKFKTGDLAAVGCLVGSCRDCPSCAENLEQYCEKGMVLTYNSPDAHIPGAMTYGGYSTQIVVDEHFVLRVPASLDPAAAAPLLCAGITTYSPLRHWNAGPGKKVGIVGLGGLGHMGVKLAHAMGAHTVLFTTSPGKAADAQAAGRRRRGRVERRRPDGTARRQLRLHPQHRGGAARSGRLHRACSSATRRCAWSARQPLPTRRQAVFNLVFKRRGLAGSLIGGIAETQEMLDFCAKHGIVSDIEMIRMDQINVAYERMLRSDVRYRFVIDMASLR